MKTFFKTPSFIFFISVVLLIFPLHSWARGKPSGEKVKAMNMETRILNGIPVCFKEDQEKEKKNVNYVYLLEEDKEEIENNLIESEWIINALKEGKDINIENATINGDLDFRIGEVKTKSLKKLGEKEACLITTAIRIVNCRLKGTIKKKELESRSVIFMKNIDFEKTTFENSVNFDNFIFNGSAIFTDTIFKDKGYFRHAKFLGLTNFNNANFKIKADYNGTEFLGENTGFSGTRFQGEASFIKSKFKEQVNFDEATFDGEAKFDKSTFKVAIFSGACFKEKSRFLGADIITAYFNEVNFHGMSNFEVKSFGKSEFKNAKFKNTVSFDGAIFNDNSYFNETSFDDTASFNNTNFEKDVNFDKAMFSGETNFRDTKFKGKVNFSYASLELANLTNADLRNATLLNANLKNAILSGADLTGIRYEPNVSPSKGALGGIKGLATVSFEREKQSGLVQLRVSLKESGLRDLERQATYAIEYWKTYYAPWYKKWVKRFLFEWTCGYGFNYLRPLVIMFCMFIAFSIVYIFPIIGYGENGIYRIWPKGRIKQGKENALLVKSEKLERLVCGKKSHNKNGGINFPKVIVYAFYFGLLSAFHIGWRDLNVGSWIARIQPREYTLRATGWVRVVSGVQSLISIYLLALWVLTQFGRPFE